ncbi:hypothetical protein [Chromohalobacter canadensis]|uniref:hypothetical protein n=1 Tax=Chromohalobacter canadensis TaxID=141389 RepID=UPI001C5354EC|nr:hypothetical protein [Chromohalobacter canadensis]
MIAGIDIERIEQIQAALIILEQRLVGPIILVAFREDARRLAMMEDQHHPGIEVDVTPQGTHRGQPEIGAIQLVRQGPEGAMPGHAFQTARYFHLLAIVCVAHHLALLAHPQGVTPSGNGHACVIEDTEGASE